MLTDRYQLPLSTASSDARNAYVQGCEAKLTMYPGAIEAFDRAIAADPAFALAHTAKAHTLLERGEVSTARTSMAAANSLTAGLSEREVSHVAFFDLLVRGDAERALAALLAHLNAWPRDTVVLATTAFTNGLIGNSGRAGQKRMLLELLDYTATICGTLKNCAWVQFIFSQTQCGVPDSLSNPPCAFIEYWLLNHDSNCPNTPASSPAWQYYNGSRGGGGAGMLPERLWRAWAGGTLVRPPGLRVVGETKEGGNDTVIASDASGTLSMEAYPSILDLATGWTGVEYNLVGDCCSTETFFTTSPNGPFLTLRVAPVNGTMNAPKCLPTFAGGSLVGSTAESNNLTLMGDCTPVSGADPAIVFSEYGGGPFPIGVSVGDTHLTTVNGLHYDFQASGDFVLAETGPDFIVQNQQASGAPTWPNAAVNKAVATKMGTTSVTICVAPTRLFIDGISSTIADGMSSSLPDGVTLSRSGNVYFIQNDNGDSVRAQLNHNTQPPNDWIDISVGLRNASEAPMVCGLLGNPDGDANEIALVNGVVLKEPVSFGVLYQPYGASWRVPFGQSLLCGGQEVEYVIPAQPFYANDLNQQQSERAREICTAAGVNEPSALEDCTLDVTVLGTASAADVFVDAPPPVAVWQAH